MGVAAPSGRLQVSRQASFAFRTVLNPSEETGNTTARNLVMLKAN